MDPDEKDTYDRDGFRQEMRAVYSLAMTSIIVALIGGFVAGVGVAGGW